MTTTSYWLAGQASAGSLPPAYQSHESVDVAIVGGGVTGCSCALTLAAAGLRVRLYEQHVVAGGASGRNGGFALRGGAMTYDDARARLGDGAGALWQLSERTLERLEQLAGDAFDRVGSLRLAADWAERESLELEHAALREDGFDVEWLDDLPRPLDRLFHGAILHPGDGSLHPVRWVRRLAQRAVAAGAEIVEGSCVDLADLDAPAVVVAVDAVTGSVLPELAEVVHPVRGQVLATEPLRERLFARPHYARHGYDYWQQLPDGRLVVGGKRDASFATENTVDEATTPRIQRQIEAFIVDLLGWLPKVTHRWAGIWGATRDGLPLVGPVPGRAGVWVAGGYCGHGNVLGLACGDLVARAILGDRPPELSLFDPSRALA